MSYDHRAIDQKWQKIWEELKAFEVKEDSAKEKFYCLIEFPFPSGAGLHVGHVRSYAALDAVCRKKRMEGKNVLYPIGWDAFGLPTENYALKTGRAPREITMENTDTFRRQLKSVGLSFDWSREVDTTDPGYYKWTQWMFLEFFKAGLAYKTKTEINWCVSCKIGLANEEVTAGACERCGGHIEKREKEQWMIAITKYADRLLTDLDTVDYLPKIKKQQQDWIGRSEGAEIDFKLAGVPGQDDGKHGVKVFTTRPDTIDGVTFLAVSPELAKKWMDIGWQANDEVKSYVETALKQTDEERMNEGRSKSGVDAGMKAINPVNGESVPVWIADYVLGHYGTGAVMGVPQHDERDHEFATVFGLPIVDRPLIPMEQAIERAHGTKTTRYKLRDWVFSRQRYWGEPIPLVWCEEHQWVAVPEDQLPVVLPVVEKYQPTDTGESPLANIDSFVNTTCPTCGKPAKRETDTMPNWAGSSWYFLRYVDAHNDQAFASPEALKYWLPVDLYNGGMEHTTLHLLYSRFWHKFLFDRGHVPTSEPYAKRHSHGLILAEDGSKMSKSKGNVVNPDDIINEHGADVLRLYEMFIGPFEEPVPWSNNGVIGVRRFLERVMRLPEFIRDQEPVEVTKSLHKAIKKVSSDLENFKFNTAVSTLMSLVNDVYAAKAITKDSLINFAKILCPLAPHVANELASVLGHEGILEVSNWPQFDPALVHDDIVSVAVQVNGRTRATIELSPDADEATAVAAAKANEAVAKHLTREPKKIIYVKGRMVSFVV